MKKIAANAHREHTEIMVQLLERAMTEGDIAREDPQLLSAMIHGAALFLMESFLMRKKESREGDEVSIERVFDILENVIFRSLEERGSNSKNA